MSENVEKSEDANGGLRWNEGLGAQWTEGICGDGAAILCDGVMMPIAEAVWKLNEGERFKEALQEIADQGKQCECGCGVGARGPVLPNAYAKGHRARVALGSA